MRLILDNFRKNFYSFATPYFAYVYSPLDLSCHTCAFVGHMLPFMTYTKGPLREKHQRAEEVILMQKHKIVLLALMTFISSLAAQTKLPKEAQAFPEKPNIRIAKASWYSKHSPGINKRTANNEIFNDKAMTAAMWGVPYNQQVKVTNLANGKSIIVRVNDRGPHYRFVREGRGIDLTKAAFDELADVKKGLISVQLELL